MELSSQFKESLTQFKIGGLVVHPAFGTGHIVEIEEKQFSAKEARCTCTTSFLQTTQAATVK